MCVHATRARVGMDPGALPGTCPCRHGSACAYAGRVYTDGWVSFLLIEFTSLCDQPISRSACGVPGGICHAAIAPAAVLWEGLLDSRDSAMQELLRISSSLSDSKTSIGSSHNSYMKIAYPGWDPHLQALGKECARSPTPLEVL